jgi:hypothetical protein
MSTRKATKASRPGAKSEMIEISSGNVFADLGFEDSEERLLKAKLASKIVPTHRAESVDPSTNGHPHRVGSTQGVAPVARPNFRVLRQRLFGVLNRLNHCPAN